MNGPLNYYRTAKFRHDEELGKLEFISLLHSPTLISSSAAGLPSKLPTNLPVLFIWGTSDLTATQFLISKARKFIDRLQDIALEGRGHWILTEAKDDVTEMVASWLNGLTSQPHGQGKL